MSRIGSSRWLVAAAAPLMVVGGVALPLVSATTASAVTTHQLTQEVVTNPTVTSTGLPFATLEGSTTVAPTSTKQFYIDVQIDTGGQLAAEQAAVSAIYTPGSFTYHQFFTDASWDAEFGVPTATYDSVLTWATSDGLTAVYHDQSLDLIELEGTATEVNNTFGVTEQNWTFTYNSKSYTYYANNVGPTVPADVSAVQGLTNVGFIEKEAVTGKSTPLDQACTGANEVADPSDTSGEMCLGGLEGTELRTVYDVGSTYTGSGQALAVNGDGDTQGPTADLHKYESDRSLPLVNTVFVNTDFDDCVASGVQASDCDTSGEGEWALDSDSSTAMAPGVGTLYYFFPAALGNASGFQAWAEYNETSSGPIPMQENASWGECEEFGSSFVPIADGTMTTYTAAFAKAVGLGKTQFVSAGDLGAGCTLTGLNGVTPGGPPVPQWPCSSPLVVCVGGTVLYTNDETGASEQRAGLASTCTPHSAINSLNECAEEAWSYTGGGSSYINPAPSWQQSMPDSSTVIVGHCLVNSQGVPYTTAPQCRGVPDVSTLSGDITCCQGTNGNGFYDVEGGSPDNGGTCTTATGCPGSESEDGGTSLADPMWEGFWADIQSDPQGPEGWGFASPLLYQIGDNPAQDECAFFDVEVAQTGSNFTYPAEPRTSATDPTGWDYVSGLGSPDVQCIETELAANSVPTNTPEAPGTALLLVVPGFALAALAIRRRRRTRPAG